MLLMLGVGLRLGSPGVIGMLVLIVILQFVTAPVSAHLTVRVAFRNTEDGQSQSDEPDPDGPGPVAGRRQDKPGFSTGGTAADDGPEQMAQSLLDENRKSD